MKRKVATIGKRKWRFSWSGGQYIDVTSVGSRVPVDVINVWNYRTGRVRADADFDTACRTWILENLDAEGKWHGAA